MNTIPSPSPDQADTLARGLGWFSLALGAAELMAPKTLNRALGAHDGTTVTRMYGLREIAAGIGILASDNPRPWVWARVAGDVVDLATLAPLLSRDNPQRAYAATAFGNVAAITALDVYSAMALEPDTSRTAGYGAIDHDQDGFPVDRGGPYVSTMP